jgi:hypothetical protein
MTKTIETTDRQKGAIEVLQGRANLLALQAQEAQNELKQHVMTLIQAAGGNAEGVSWKVSDDFNIVQVDGVQANGVHRRAAKKNGS